MKYEQDLSKHEAMVSRIVAVMGDPNETITIYDCVNVLTSILVGIIMGAGGTDPHQDNAQPIAQATKTEIFKVLRKAQNRVDLLKEAGLL